MQSGLNGSNSNLPDNTGRAFTTSFTAQSGSSGAVLNQSGGTHFKLLIYIYFEEFEIGLSYVLQFVYFSCWQETFKDFTTSTVASTCQTCLGHMHQEIQQILVVFQMVSNKLQEACLMEDML